MLNTVTPLRADCPVAPAPLVPADVDLRGYGFMPLDVARLRDSRIVDAVTGEEFRAAILLWCAAWHQVPAGSLPNDEIQLAKLAGYGRVLTEWAKVREGALYGFVLCSDGRLYHPTVCEKARDAWAEKQAYAEKRDADRRRKSERRVGAGGGIPTDNPPVSGGQTQDFHRMADGIPAENAHKGQGQRQREVAVPAAAAAVVPIDRGDLRRRCEEAAGLAGLRRFELVQALVDEGVDVDRRLLPVIRDVAEECCKAGRKPDSWGYFAKAIRDQAREVKAAALVPAVKPLERVEQGSPEGQAWERLYRSTKGKGVPWVNGCWHFETRWPPAEGMAA